MTLMDTKANVSNYPVRPPFPGAPVLAVERPGYDAHKVQRCVPSSVAEAAPEVMLERPDEAEAATQGGGWLLE